MSIFDFDKVLESFNNDPAKVLSKYKYQKVDSIVERIESVSDDDSLELNDIINAVALWKLNRTVHVSDETLTKLNSIKGIKSPNDAITSTREALEDLLTSLLESKGIRLAMASTFMHFFNQAVFPIFDQRAYRVIYKKDYVARFSTKYNVDLYVDYLQKCIEYYNQNLVGSIPFSEIDKYLYQIDIEAGNDVKM